MSEDYGENQEEVLAEELGLNDVPDVTGLAGVKEDGLTSVVGGIQDVIVLLRGHDPAGSIEEAVARLNDIKIGLFAMCDSLADKEARESAV